MPDATRVEDYCNNAQTEMGALTSHAAARMYFIWPVYKWDASPIGLQDTTLLMLAWSVTRQVASRRLLSKIASKPVKNKFAIRPLYKIKRDKRNRLLNPKLVGRARRRK